MRIEHYGLFIVLSAFVSTYNLLVRAPVMIISGTWNIMRKNLVTRAYTFIAGSFFSS